MVDTAKEKLGGVDILVNNAGTMYSGRFASLKDDELKNQFETKLFGFMRAIRLVHPMMKAQKWGRIVNTIGGAGKEPDPYMFGSAMTNSALLNLTKSLSEEFGEDNVLVNAICPGWVATDLWVRNAEGLKKELNVKSEDEARKLAARKNSLGRMGKPEELANATVFLCSERASYITGVSLNLDGGRLKGLWWGLAEITFATTGNASARRLAELFFVPQPRARFRAMSPEPGCACRASAEPLRGALRASPGSRSLLPRS